MDGSKGVDDPDDLPRTEDGHVDFDALFGDDEMQEKIFSDAVPFWSVAERPGGNVPSSEIMPNLDGPAESND